MMRSARVWATITIAVLVVVNVWVFYPSKQRPLSRAEKEKARLEFIETERRRWAESRVVPLDDPSLEALIGELNSKDCLEVPAAGKPIAVSKLDEDAKRDLPAAIGGLCRAYLVDTGKSVAEYMRERGESFATKDAASWRDALQRKGRDVPAGADGDIRLADAIYHAYPELRSHWKSLRPDASCMRLYQVSEYGEALAHSLGAVETHRWKGSASSTHSFEPKHTFRDQLKVGGALLLCDVKLCIDLDAKLRGATVPFYVRFWWSTVDRHWHPLEIAFSPRDVADMGSSVALFF